MADEYDDYGVYDDEPEIEYEDYGEDPYMQQNDGGIDLEENFILAQNSDEPEAKYREIIELERDLDGYHWSFKSYEKLCAIFIKRANYDNLPDCLQKLFDIYPKEDDIEKQNTISDLMYELHDQQDKQFVIDTLKYMLDLLQEKGLERPYVDTGVEFAKVLFGLEKNELLGELLEELLSYISKLDQEDENYKSKKLELLVMKIKFCNIMDNIKESRKLYLEANQLMQDKIFQDTRLSAIINEEGGKMHLTQKQYDVALVKFLKAFHDYQESGNIRAKTLFKYCILASIITRNRENIVSPEEAKPFLDKKLDAMLELQAAYEEMDIIAINNIWNQKISKIEDDKFILENLQEILHNIRINYISKKLRAYKICKLETLVRELGIDSQNLEAILYEIIVCEGVKAKLNLEQQYVEIVEEDSKRDKTLNHFAQWINILHNQSA